jgi:hypothetical protein
MRIDQYVRGSHMVVAGRSYSGDLKIVGDTVTPNWWRRSGHYLQAEDVTDILAACPEILVVGTGYAAGMRIAEELSRLLAKRNIRLISEQTADAVASFNRLRAAGANVAGAFHLTC